MIHLLSSTAFLIVNKRLARIVGLKPTIILADLISKREYFIEHGQCTKDGWFFNTEANITKDTTLSPRQQRKALKTLINYKLLEVKRMGIPAKKHYKINEQQVIQLVSNYSDTDERTNNNNKEIKINKSDILNRKLLFEESVFSISDVDSDTLDDFVSYWTEPNKSNTKMKFEMQKTWDLNRRLRTWIRNSKKWDVPTTQIKGKVDRQIDEYNKGKEYL